MKTLVLTLVLVAVLATSSFAATATIDVYPGMNLISVPIVPFDPAVESVFTGFDMWFTCTLQRWDASNSTYLLYDPFDVPGAFGNILLGDGYWFETPSSGTVTYNGVPDGIPDASGNMTDMWISLPGKGQGTGGAHLIGTPFAHDIPVDPNWNMNGDGIFFTDGTELKIWDDAVNAGWVESVMQYWDASSRSYKLLGYFFNDDDHMRAGNGYWIVTKKDNLAMIVPAN